MAFACWRCSATTSQTERTWTSLKPRNPPRSSRPRPPMPMAPSVILALAPNARAGMASGAARAALAAAVRPRNERRVIFFLVDISQTSLKRAGVPPREGERSAVVPAPALGVDPREIQRRGVDIAVVRDPGGGVLLAFRDQL